MNGGVSVQAHACHSGNLHDTVGRDLPKLELVDRNLQENNSQSLSFALIPPFSYFSVAAGLVKDRMVKTAKT